MTASLLDSLYLNIYLVVFHSLSNHISVGICTTYANRETWSFIPSCSEVLYFWAIKTRVADYNSKMLFGQCRNNRKNNCLGLWQTAVGLVYIVSSVFLPVMYLFPFWSIFFKIFLVFLVLFIGKLEQHSHRAIFSSVRGMSIGSKYRTVPYFKGQLATLGVEHRIHPSFYSQCPEHINAKSNWWNYI